MKLILPVAGSSTRFPGTRPKWLLTHPNGNLMFFESICGLDLQSVDEILVVCREDHYRNYGVEAIVRNQFDAAECTTPYRVVQAPETKSQAETVAQCIERLGIVGPIFVKDSDNYFETKLRIGNVVCTIDLAKVPLIHATSKSYVLVDESGNISKMVEKEVISSTIGIGGYGFESAQDYLAAYNSLQNSSSLYLSHVIQKLVGNLVNFESQAVDVYYDWGTLEDWNRFKRRHAVLFLDLDGTLVKNSSEMMEPYWGSTEGLKANIAAIRKLHEAGMVKIILTTSRKQRFAAVTREQLKSLDIPFDEIVFDVPHCQRIVVNDFSATNPYPSAAAVNLPRDSEMLGQLLSGVIGE